MGRYTTTTFTCNSKSAIEVFNIDGNNENDWNKLKKATSYQFTKSCRDKTILINLLGQGTLRVPAVDMYDWNGKVGYAPGGFDKCMTGNMLWNVPYASTVE